MLFTICLPTHLELKELKSFIADKGQTCLGSSCKKNSKQNYVSDHEYKYRKSMEKFCFSIELMEAQNISSMAVPLNTESLL